MTPTPSARYAWTMRYALELIGLGKQFQTGPPALHPLSLTVPEGAVNGLVGPAGSGKTTLIHLVAGLLAPSQGRIRLHGVDVTDTPSRPQVGAALHGSYPQGVTLREQLTYCALVRGASPRLAHERCDQVLAHLGLEARQHQPVASGLAQEASLGCALIGEPPVLLVDDLRPDLGARAAAWARARHRPMLYATRSLEAARVFCDAITQFGM